MSYAISNKAVSTAGALIFCISTMANLVRIGLNGSLTSTLELFVLQPAVPTELLVAIGAVSLLVKCSWSKRTVTVAVVVGAVMIGLSITGLYSLWKFSSASVVPVARVVWVFPIVTLLGGVLVSAGALGELGGRRVGETPAAA